MMSLLSIFATFRLARIVSEDQIGAGVRAALGKRAATQGGAWYWLAELVHCPYCVGVWVAALLALPVLRERNSAVRRGKWLRFLVQWFGVAGGQYLLERGVEWLE